jgi:hypothetical protein
MSSFELSGKDIAVRYNARDKTLFVEGKGLPGGTQKTFSRIRTSRSDIGRTIKVVLLPSSRNGTQILLRLLVPDTEQSNKDVAITGAAILVQDFSNLVGRAPAVLQAYDTRLLTGKMQAAAGSARARASR